MTETKLLIGSLSNDLLRVANLIQRGSNQGALRFFKEAQRWSSQLTRYPMKPYIEKIVQEVNSEKEVDILDMEKAERFLMYSILLQNYSLHATF